MPGKRSKVGKSRFPSAEVAERVADTMFALSTPSRVQILGCLMSGPLSVSELVDALAMEQSAVSHQLRTLREQGLVSVERVGRRMVYALTDEHVQALLEDALRHTERRAAQGSSFPLRVKRGSRRSQAESG
jgi:DNA-binding transcriptional ArsR family regulator